MGLIIDFMLEDQNISHCQFTCQKPHNNYKLVCMYNKSG
jgi:hypothetical protein